MRTTALLLVVLVGGCGGGGGTGAPSAIDGGAGADASVSAAPLATLEGNVVGMVVDGDAVYLAVGLAPKWRIVRIPASGGAVTDLASDGFMGASIAVDATHVYWVNRSGHEVRRVPKGGGAAEALTKQDDARLLYVAIDGDDIYVQSEGVDAVRTFTKNGALGQSFNGSEGVQPCGLATDATNLYICSSSGLYSVPKVGGTRTTIHNGAPDSTGRTVAGFALDGASTFVSVRVDPCVKKGILHVPSGGAAVELASSCGTNAMIANGGTLWWTSTYNGLRSIPAGGGEPRTYDETAIGPLALDNTYLYFTRRDETTATSSLFRTPR